MSNVQKAVDKKDLKYLRDKDREMVKGIFKFYEVPGGSMSFCFKKYKGDPIEKFDMVDGNVYTVPLGVAKHLNNDCHYPIHSYSTDSNGIPLQKISERVNRCGFQSLEFMEMEDFDRGSKHIVTVENLAK
jgi:hypothetical protein